MAERVLIVEDEPNIVVSLEFLLGHEGYEVQVATSGPQALERAASFRPDLVLLDVMLPEKNGFEVCEELRERDEDLPIIMLTAKGEEEDKVRGLRLGADDYVTKPFGVGELVARIRVALRHAVRMRDGERVLSLDDATIDLEERRVLRGGAEVRLTPIEFRLVAALAKHGGRVVTHRQLLREVWGPTHENDTHYLRIYVKQLRDKLEVDPANPRHFLTELGVGYRLVPGG